MADKNINIKAKITADTGNAAENLSKVKQGLGNAAKSATESKDTFGKLKETMGGLGPVGDQATKQMGMLNQAFNILKANPIIGVFALIAGLVYALFQKFKEMEAVSDALNKAFGVLSSAMSAFMDAILTPLIDGFVKIVELVSGGVIDALDALGLASKENSNRTGELIDSLDELEDAQRDSALATAEANRKLQDAREIAADANVPIRERIAALREAARIEKEESQKIIEINRAKSAKMMEMYALEHHANERTIELIRQGTLESIKAAREQLLLQKNANKDKIAEITNMIIAAENEAAAMAKISKKTQQQIRSIEKEEADKREADRKAREEKRKKQEEEARKEKERQDRINIARTKINVDDEAALKTAKLLDEKTRESEHTEFLKNNTQYRLNNTVAATLKQMDADKAWSDSVQKNAQDRAKANVDAAKMSADALGALSDVIGKQTIAGKTLAIAQALINTYLGVTEVLRNKTVLPEPAGTIQKIASVTAILASGFSAVKNIKSTPVPGGGGGGANPQSIAQSPITPQSLTTQLSQQTISNIGNAAAGGAARAYVLESDINNSMERQQRIQRAARLG